LYNSPIQVIPSWPLLPVSTLRVLALLLISNMLTAQLLAQRAHRKREHIETHPADHYAEFFRTCQHIFPPATRKSRINGNQLKNENVKETENVQKLVPDIV
jgi:hypothetical protein